MKKVLFLIKTPAAGGAETYLLRFIKFCPGNYTVLCKGGNKGELEEEYINNCTLKTDLHIGYFSVSEYLRLFRYLSHEKFDCVCDMQGNFSGFVLLCAKLAGIPNRIAFYRESRNKFSGSFFRNLYKKVVTVVMEKCSTRILANSYEALNHFHPDWKKNIYKYQVIYNGFDSSIISNKTKEEMRKSLSLPSDAFVIGHSGRYCEAKNHEMIIKTAIRVCQNDNKVHFVLMGRGVKEHYQNVIDDKKLSDKIHLLGYRNDVLDVLRALDMFYFPSLTEGQPNALIEAMISGLPFVASNIPSIIETTPADAHNYLISPYNYDENYKAIVNTIKKIRNNEVETYANCTREKYDAHKLFNQFKVLIEL